MGGVGAGISEKASWRRGLKPPCRKGEGVKVLPSMGLRVSWQRDQPLQRPRSIWETKTSPPAMGEMEDEEKGGGAHTSPAGPGGKAPEGRSGPIHL